MTIIDIFSKRGKPLPSGLHYHLPGPLRVQILGIVDEAFAPARYRDRLYEMLVSWLAHELGRASLVRSTYEPRG